MPSRPGESCRAGVAPPSSVRWLRPSDCGSGSRPHGHLLEPAAGTSPTWSWPASAVVSDPYLRRATPADLDVVYPASVAMHTEELGVSPERGGATRQYRARVADLIERGLTFIRLDQGRVVFKADVAASTPNACQVQGVYVDPACRNQGLATAGMAAVVEISRHEIAPIVSLYVNEHNTAARRVYEKVGFTQTAEFGTVLF